MRQLHEDEIIKTRGQCFVKFIKSIIQIHELTPPSKRVDSPIKTTIHVEESSFELQFQHVSP